MSIKRCGDTKRCPHCNKDKPPDGFGKEANSHQHWCGDCLDEQNKTADREQQHGH